MKTKENDRKPLKTTESRTESQNENRIENNRKPLETIDSQTDIIENHRKPPKAGTKAGPKTIENHRKLPKAIECWYENY